MYYVSHFYNTTTIYNYVCILEDYLVQIFIYFFLFDKAIVLNKNNLMIIFSKIFGLK